MEIEDEMNLLWNMREDARDLPCDLKDSLAALYAPRKGPLHEFGLLLQLMAEGEGFPARCSNRACKRVNECRPGDPAYPHCAPLWPEALLARALDIGEGIVFADRCNEARKAAIRNAIAEFDPPMPIVLGPKKRRRSAAGTPG
jgi:hypothetical protein